MFFLVSLLAAVGNNGKIDNYAAPGDTVTGATYDEVTGQTLQTSSIRGAYLNCSEISYDSAPVLYFYFYSMPRMNGF